MFSSPLPEVIQLMVGICFPGQFRAAPLIFNNIALVAPSSEKQLI